MPDNGGKGGRRRKPLALHVIQGTHRPDRQGELDSLPPVDSNLPEPPAILSARASEIFNSLTSVLVGMGLASATHGTMQSLLAMRLEECERLQAVIEDLGYTYQALNPATGQYQPKARPEAALRNVAFRHAQSLLAEFGLSPAALSKVTAAKAPQRNEFADFA